MSQDYATQDMNTVPTQSVTDAAKINNMTYNISGNRFFVNISSLNPYPRNNYFFDDIIGSDWDNLLKSIKEIGLQEPIIITKDNMIVSGHQRVRACKELGIDTVEAVYREYATEDDLTRAVIEINIIQRGVGNPNPVKFGRCIKELERIYGIRNGGDRKSEKSEPNGLGLITQDDLAEKLHLSTETLRNYKKLADTIPELQELIIDGKISPKAARALAKRLSQDEQLELISSLDVSKKYTMKEIESAVQEYKKQLESKDEQIEADRKKYNDFLKQRDEKFNRERDKLNKELNSKEVEIERLYANPPKPADYDSTKVQNMRLKDNITLLEDKIKRLQSQVDAYNGQAAHFTEASDEYKKIMKQRDEAKKELEQLKFESSAQFELAKLTVVVRDFLRNKIAPIKFLECFKSISTNPVVGDDLIDIIDMTEKWCAEMRNVTRNIEYRGGRSGEYVDVEVVGDDIEYYT